MKTWLTWDEPERQIAVAQWRERDLAVVFPLHWGGSAAMIARAKARIAAVEAKAGKRLAPGSVLLAFSRHKARAAREALAVPHPLIGTV